MEHYQKLAITHLGIDVIVKFYYDSDAEAPWEDCEGTGKVRCANSRSDKKPGEVSIHHNRDGVWLYDFAGAIEIAKRDGWGCPSDVDPTDLTKRQIALAAVKADLTYLQGWLENRWWYVGIECTILDENGEEAFQESLWRVETYKDYHLEEARHMAENLAAHAHGVREAERIAAQLEAEEVKYWLNRGVVTGLAFVQECY